MKFKNKSWIIRFFRNMSCMYVRYKRWTNNPKNAEIYAMILANRCRIDY